MAQADEVRAFARDFVNGNQTAERRSKIRAVYYQLTGSRMTGNCSTCYIDAVFKILKIMDKEPCKYKLLKGAVLTAFGDASKTCTNLTLTDELAEWHLRNVRGAGRKFAFIPPGAPNYGDPEPGTEQEEKPASVEGEITPVKMEKVVIKKPAKKRKR
jgi:hypothetical protein